MTTLPLGDGGHNVDTVVALGKILEHTNGRLSTI
jgi:hypothetical protein